MSRRHRWKIRHDNFACWPRVVNGRTYYATNRVFRMLLKQIRKPVKYPVLFDAEGRVRPSFMGIPIGPTKRMGDV